MENDGSKRMNRELIVVVRTQLSTALIEEPGLTKSLSNVYQLTEYSTVRFILRS